MLLKLESVAEDLFIEIFSEKCSQNGLFETCLRSQDQKNTIRLNFEKKLFYPKNTEIGFGLQP